MVRCSHHIIDDIIGDKYYIRIRICTYVCCDLCRPLFGLFWPLGAILTMQKAQTVF